VQYNSIIDVFQQADNQLLACSVWSIDGLKPKDIADKINNFNISDVKCFKQEDKDHILSIVKGYKTGTSAFVSNIKSLTRQLNILSENDGASSGTTVKQTGQPHELPSKVASGMTPHELNIPKGQPHELPSKVAFGMTPHELNIPKDQGDPTPTPPLLPPLKKSNKVNDAEPAAEP
jgi:hypothetical protein